MKKNMHYNFKKIKNQTGFSLMEVLIALLVLSLGLLGLAALQAISLKSNHGAYQRTQATFLAYDIMDRMRANLAQAVNGDYNRALGASVATGTTLAQTDVSDWLTNYIQVLLPAGDGSIACDTAAVCTVVIQWDESRLGGTATGGTGTLSTFSFTAQLL